MMKKYFLFLYSLLAFWGCNYDQTLEGSLGNAGASTTNSSTGSSSDSSNQSNTETTTNYIPSDIILPFKSSTCPDDWELFDELKGRMILGLGSGNTDKDGSNLTARTFGDVGGVEYTAGIRYFSGAGNTAIPTAGVLAAYALFNEEDPSFGECMIGSNCARGNIPPFISYTYCKFSNNSDSENIPKEVVIHHESSCSGDWSVDTNSQGRFIIGAGNGNVDKDGEAIANYTYGESGGKETTNGFYLNEDDAEETVSSDASRIFSGDGASDAYKSGTPTEAMNGETLADGNLSPYYVLNNCSPTEDLTTGLISGTIAAFNSATCPSGWTSYTNLAGRSPLGAGSGNNDRDGTALTTRTSGQSGGQEFTSGVPVINATGDTDSPSGAYLAKGSGNESIYSTNTFDSYSHGGDNQSNMSPFYVTIFCQKE